MSTIYSTLPFVAATLSFLLGIFVYSRFKKTLSSHSLSGLCFSISVWLYSYSLCYSSLSSEAALFWARNSYLGIILIPIMLYQIAIDLINLKRPKTLFIFYSAAVMLLVLSRTDKFFSHVAKFFWGYYPQAAILYSPFLIFFFGIYIYACILVFVKLLDASITLQKRNQLKYVFIAYLIGCGASVDYLGKYGLEVYPFGYINMVFVVFVFTYAIIRYRLLDISLVITRTSIFVAVYSLVLGIPFALAFGGRERLINLIGPMWWMVPLVTSTVLATVGPFIYVFVQRRAEDRLFQEQRRYQATLRQASTGMGKIKDLKRLVTMIVHIMTRTVRVEFSMVFLNDVYAKKFRLGAYRSRQVRSKFRSDIDTSTALVQFLKETQNPIVYDEIKQRTQDYGDLKLARLEAELKAMDAAIVVPSFIDEKLIAILVMGNKISGKTYSSDDLAVFSILANQSALAIENAQFYDEMKNTHAQLLKAEKMATIGTLADGLSHQINNRLHAMGFIAGDALDTLKLGHNLPMSLEVKEMVLDLEHAFNRIESNVQQGGEIVQGLLKYTRKDDASVKDISLDQLIAAALDMTQFKIKPGEMAISHEYPPDLPKIHGNFTQLQEVFFNLIDNAYDAMMQRRFELQEKDFTPTIRIRASGGTNGHLTVVVEDNGIGIQEQDKEKIFTPFFTTKLSSKKGTGLGLYVIQRLIEENHKGKVVYESKYQQGTTVHLTLPAA